MKPKIIFLFFLAISFASFAQKKELKTITENDLKAHLEFVASDFMQGRDFDTQIPGLEITADYLRAQCKKMGLTPGVPGYFQSVDMVSVKTDAENTYLRIVDSANVMVYGTKDILSLGGSTETEILEGDIVFAGYGWYNNETKYNDTKDLDIKGKIVLVMTRNLELVNEEKSTDFNIEMKKMQKAMLGGAKALILVPDPLNPNTEFMDGIKNYAKDGVVRLKGAKKKMRMPIKLLMGTTEMANAILKQAGKTLAELQTEINESASPKSFVVENATTKLQLAKTGKEIEGKNIVAIVEGSDPVLKNECVLFTAHYDHVGMGDEGKVYNGADDNGSGTVALLEIAEAFQSMKKKPKRSIVFAWVTAEEKGLIGSDYYSQNPVIPMGNTLLDINLDMIGRSADTEAKPGDEISKQLAGPNGIYIVSGKQSAELIDISGDVCEKLGLIPSDELTKAFLTRSDYYHFYKNGVPILGLSTGMHNDYHKTTDELDKIDYTKMKRVAQYGFLVAHKVANQKKRIVLDTPVK